METLGQYTMTVIMTALICGIILNLVKKTYFSEYIRLLCGLCMAVAVLGPIAKMNPTEILVFEFPYMQDGGSEVVKGEKLSRCQMEAIIKSESEAYILDKASALGADLNVKVSLSLSDIPYPTGAEMHGDVSPLVKQKLSEILETELGIPKENQLWTG